MRLNLETPNSDELFAQIEDIATKSSKTAKVTLVGVYGKEAEFRRVLVAALDPFVTYGIAKVPQRTMVGAGYFDEGSGDTWALLTQLATRELTGNAARDAVQVEIDRLMEPSSQLFRRIILKDLRAGFGESTVNKAIPGLIPDFPYMRCSLPKHVKLAGWPWEKGIISQEKADGMFANLNHEANGLVRLTSRQGSPFPMEQFDDLIAFVREFVTSGTQLHGELLVRKDGVICAREIGNGILNSVLQGGAFDTGEEPIYFAWDQIPLYTVKPKGKFLISYRERLTDLSDQMADADCYSGRVADVINTRTVYSLKEAYAHYRELLDQGKEGTIIKLPGMSWKDGDSREQVKLKLEADCDLEIVGFNVGKGKNADTFGSIICRSLCGKLEVSVSGFVDAERIRIHGMRDLLVGTVMTVKSNSIMPAKNGGKASLFLPRFVEFRMDKQIADDFTRIQDQFDAAIAAVAAV